MRSDRHGRHALRAACCLLLLLLAMSGCGPSRTAPVSGQVKFKGEPLPSGSIAFVAEDGRAKSANIKEGKYTIPDAPLGAVRIAVQTFPPSPSAVPPTAAAGSVKLPSLKYVRIPSQYGDDKKSGLTYTVQPGAQTHDVELKP